MMSQIAHEVVENNLILNSTIECKNDFNNSNIATVPKFEDMGVRWNRLMQNIDAECVKYQKSAVLLQNKITN